ncbi:MAG: copper resistance protein CopC [Acidimicrobiales bacterium]|nr:copper resistance protein CopC [Acidimicrobiales bacterium]
MSVVRHLLLTTAAVVVAIGGTAGVAGAHTEVQRATPGPGEVVTGAPEAVELRFLDPVLPGVRIDVSDADERAVAGLGDVTVDDGNRRARVGFAPLDPGVYVVTIEFVAEDGDRQREAYRFTVEAAGEPRDPSGLVGAAGATAGLAAAFGAALWRRTRS